jgi:hypothetical protein
LRELFLAPRLVVVFFVDAGLFQLEALEPLAGIPETPPLSAARRCRPLALLGRRRRVEQRLVVEEHSPQNSW